MTTKTASEPAIATGPLPLQWRDDRIVITDDEALAKVDRSAMSASTMNAMQGCPARYVAEKLLPRDEDPFSPASLGSSAHVVFEKLFSEKPVRRTPERAMQILIDLADEIWRPEEEVERLQWSATVMDKVLPLFRIEDPTAINVVSLEERFDGVDVGGVSFIGFIDRVHEPEPGVIEIDDFKSGRARTAADAKRWGDPEGDQLRLYVAAYQARHGVKPKVAALLYTGVGRSRKVSVTGPAMKRTVEKFTQAWDDLKRQVACGQFDTKVTALCGWCPLVNSCPAAQDAGKEARVPAPSAAQLGIGTDQPPRPRRALDMAADLEAELENSDVSQVETDPDFDVFAGVESAPEPGHEPFPSSHLEVSATLTEEEKNMIEGFARREAKPWEDPPRDGSLDPASFASTAMFGLVSMAVERLGEGGIKITPSTVKGLAATFATIVLDSQEQMVGSRDWQAGANTRLRGALHAVLNTVPMPFGKDEKAWDAWVAVATRRCVSIAKTVVSLHEQTYGDRPWADLSTRAVADAA